MRVEIRNLPEVQAMFNDLAETQLPFAISLTLNRTMFKLREISAERIKTVFDRPTPAVQKSTRVERATKKAIYSGRLLLSEQRTALFRVHESGIRRYHVGFERKLGLPDDWYAVPTRNMPLNQYGNQQPAKKAKILKAKSLGNRGRLEFYFIQPWQSGFDIMAGRLSPGIYETKRGSNELTKLYHYIKKVEYKPILQWENTMNEKANEILPGIARDAIEYAVRTAIR